MKIQYASDLHLEVRQPGEIPIVPEGDILVLAGDVTDLNLWHDRHAWFIQWLSDNFSQSYILPGNHEFFGGYDVELSLQGLEITAAENVRFVNNRVVRLHQDIELIFTTLWTPISAQAQPYVDRHLTDCSRLNYGTEQFKAHHHTLAHEYCLQWLKQAVRDSTARQRIVITHHCPLILEDPCYAGNGLSECFVTPLEQTVETLGADFWIYGHTHYNAGRGMQIGNTVMLTNQLGCEPDRALSGYLPTALIPFKTTAI